MGYFSIGVEVSDYSSFQMPQSVMFYRKSLSETNNQLNAQSISFQNEVQSSTCKNACLCFTFVSRSDVILRETKPASQRQSHWKIENNR